MTFSLLGIYSLDLLRKSFVYIPLSQCRAEEGQGFVLHTQRYLTQSRLPSEEANGKF